MRRTPLVAAMLFMALACGLWSDTPTDEAPTDETPTDETPTDEPVDPLPPPPPPRGRDRGRRGSDPNGTRCLTISGADTAQLRLVLVDGEVTDGSISWEDDGRTRTAGPLRGGRIGKSKVSVSGAEAGQSDLVQVQLERRSGTFDVSVDGRQLQGTAVATPCE